jgi:hypothetical protein
MPRESGAIELAAPPASLARYPYVKFQKNVRICRSLTNNLPLRSRLVRGSVGNWRRVVR